MNTPRPPAASRFTVSPRPAEVRSDAKPTLHDAIDLRALIDGSFTYAVAQGYTLDRVVLVVIAAASFWAESTVFASARPAILRMDGQDYAVRYAIGDRAETAHRIAPVYPQTAGLLAVRPNTRNTLLFGFRDPAHLRLMSEPPRPPPPVGSPKDFSALDLVERVFRPVGSDRAEAERLALEAVRQLVPWGGVLTTRVTWREVHPLDWKPGPWNRRDDVPGWGDIVESLCDAANANHFDIWSSAIVSVPLDQAFEACRQDLPYYAMEVAAAEVGYRLAYDEAARSKLKKGRAILDRFRGNPNPFATLVNLWRTGYALDAITPEGIVLVAPCIGVPGGAR